MAKILGKGSNLSFRRREGELGRSHPRLLALGLIAAASFLSLSSAVPAPAFAAGPPEVAAAWVSNVTASSAALHAEVNPAGSATTLRFEYLAEAVYRENLAATPPREAFAGAATAPAGAPLNLGSGTAKRTGSQNLVGLVPSTAYLYRAVAASSGGTEFSAVHTLITQASASPFSLPDHRAWEMVSPVEKNGGAVQGFGASNGGGVLRVAANGESATFSSSTSFDAAQGAPLASQYISRRTGSGWSTEDITTPTLSGGYEGLDGVPYRLFSEDLSRGLLLNGEHCRTTGVECPVANPPLPGSQAPAGYQDYYLRDDGAGSFAALLTEADVAGLSLDRNKFDLALAGATPDLRHVVVSTCSAITLDATEVKEGEGCVAADANLYEWSEGTLRTVNILPGGSHTTPGARLAAQGAGAISADGQRVYFSLLEDGALYMREAGGSTELLPDTVGGGAAFQAASADGSLALFTQGGTLYRYSSQTETSDPLATEVVGVLGASENGSVVYYQTASGLYRWAEGIATEIAPGAGAAAPSDYPPTTGTARVSADGAHLAFLSTAELTGYESLGDSEVFLYSAPAGGGEETLVCVSCNPTGERPQGPSTIPGAIANGDLEEDPAATDSYKPRVLSTSGERLFFESKDALMLQDTDNAPDVYEWEARGIGTCASAAGCVGLISSGTSEGGASFVDASADGRDAFFLTAGSLVPADPGSIDLYDAREGGGFPEPAKPAECNGDACQPIPPEPEDPTPGTLVASQGNPPSSHSKSRHRKPHHRKRHHGRSHKRRPRRGDRR